MLLSYPERSECKTLASYLRSNTKWRDKEESLVKIERFIHNRKLPFPFLIFLWIVLRESNIYLQKTDRLLTLLIDTKKCGVK